MNEERKNTEGFTDKEWEELASMLSDEKGEKTELLRRFIAGDRDNTAETWKALNNMDNREEIDVDKAWNNVYSRIKVKEPHITPIRNRFIGTTLIRIAAVALVLIGLGSAAVYMYNSGTFSRKTNIIAGNDEKNIIVSLSDGSKVYLNRNSELTYRKNFGKQKRNVTLTGEAFFEITPDAKKPFIIDAGNAKVNVVGTTFNVITSNKESAVEVFVKTGKVLVSDPTGTKSIQLDPGEVGIMSQRVSAKTVNNDPNYLAWKTGYLDYSGQKLDVVFNDLKRVYNMDIIADDSVILSNPWHAPIVNSSEETIIRLICSSFNLRYTKDGNVYHLSKK